MISIPELRPKDFNHKALATAFNILADQVAELAIKVDGLINEKQDVPDEILMEFDTVMEQEIEKAKADVVVSEKKKSKKAKD